MKFDKIHKVVCVNNEIYIAILDSVYTLGGKPFFVMLNHDDSKFYLNLDNVISIEQTED